MSQHLITIVCNKDFYGHNCALDLFHTDTRHYCSCGEVWDEATETEGTHLADPFGVYCVVCGRRWPCDGFLDYDI